MKITDITKLNEGWENETNFDASQLLGATQKETVENILKWNISSFSSKFDTKDEKQLLKIVKTFSNEDIKGLVVSAINLISTDKMDPLGNGFGLLSLGVPRYGSNKIFTAVKDQLKNLENARSVNGFECSEASEMYNALKALEKLEGKFQQLANSIHLFSRVCQRILVVGGESETKKNLIRLKKILGVN